LTGVGRSSLDALLANVIDPNQVIGKGYENVEVETGTAAASAAGCRKHRHAGSNFYRPGTKEEVIAKSDTPTCASVNCR